MLDNGVKITFDDTVCDPPSFTIPDDPDLLTIGLGLGGPSISLGEEVFGPEAGKKYNALQFHIHSSSEHTIDGETFDAELHIVHMQDGVDTTAALGFLEGIGAGVASLLQTADDSRPVSFLVGILVS